jgi:hypothetical protein
MNYHQRGTQQQQDQHDYHNQDLLIFHTLLTRQLPTMPETKYLLHRIMFFIPSSNALPSLFFQIITKAAHLASASLSCIHL